jgi:CarD family transcriptional regulator
MAQTARTTRPSSSTLSRASASAAPAKAKKAAPSPSLSTAKAKVKAPALQPVKAATKPATMKAAPAAKLAKIEKIESKVLPVAPKLPEAAAEPKRISGIVPKGYVPLVDIPKPPPPPRDFSLEVGDKAVHPSHGLGEVVAIEHREIAGMKGDFYILRILDNGMRVMVPRATSAQAGLRPVMSGTDAEKVLETMRAREVAVDLQPWSRRFRAYTEMIKSGSPHEVAKVLRDMYRLKFDKDLSFGERRLLDQAKSLLMKELAAAKGMTEPALQAQVDEMFRA